MPPLDTDSAYAFRPVVADDFALLRRWFEQPHVAEWWNPVESALAEVAQAMKEPSVAPHIVLIDGRPSGYIQSYRPHAEPGHPYCDQPEGAVGLDQFIGEPDLLGKGHGSTFVRQFAEMCEMDGASCVITDPDPTNGRAIRAYEKAGFEALEHRTTPFGPVLLMRRPACRTLRL